jgi:hypothetical protein
MEQGQFCFITDAFFDIHDKESKLMRNKETIDGKVHGRPCFYAFADKKNPSIYWCVPISSQVDKYSSIYNQKIAKQQAKGTRKPKCNTIRFGEVMGAMKAFLIQNMFPVTENYIGEIYINRLTKKAVRIPQNIERDVRVNADEVLRLVRSGHQNLVFSDIIKTYDDLNAELNTHEKKI